MRLDMQTEELEKDTDDHLIECKPNEPGELLLISKDDPRQTYKGYYKDSENTNRKIIVDHVSYS